MATQKRFIAKNGLDNNSQTIQNLADPVNAQDAATRAYVLANAGTGGNTVFQRTVTEVSPTTGQTVFTITYTVGYIDVFLNGIKQIVGDDFTATNGTSITFTYPCSVGDIVELITYYSTAITSANLTGAVTSIGNATSLGSFTSTQLLSALTDETGTGSVVFATSPTLVTPIISSIVNIGTLTLPISTDTLVGRNTTDILTNKEIVPRTITSGTVTGTITPTGDTSDMYIATGLTGTVAFALPSGSPINGQKLTIRIKDNGTAITLSWTTTTGGYRVIGTNLPLTTVANKTIYVGCIYNSTDSFWDVVSVASQV